MLSDEQLILEVRERLHRELAGVQPPADLVRRLRDQAAEPGRPARRRWSTPANFVAAGVSALVVVAVVAFAVHGHRPSRTASTSSSSIQTLVHRLGVLREPQAEADLSYVAREQRAVRPPEMQTAPIARWTRAVPLPGGGAVVLYLTRDRMAHRHAGRIRDAAPQYEVGIDQFRASGGSTGTCCLTAQDLNRPHGPEIEFGYQPGHHTTAYAEVVPDGVARVRWQFPRDPSCAGGGPLSDFARPLTVTAAVHHNVAAIRIPQRGYPAFETWFGKDGNILASAAVQPKAGVIIR